MEQASTGPGRHDVFLAGAGPGDPTSRPPARREQTGGALHGISGSAVTAAVRSDGRGAALQALFRHRKVRKSPAA